MSKCKAVLDGEKITEIRVKTKTEGNPPPREEAEEPERSETSSTVATPKPRSE